MSGKKADLNEKQIFVRNLPFDVTAEDLTALFEDIGPLKNTSIAQTNGVGKGFGFVKFALEADAKAAIEKLQGHTFHGRKLMLELGLKKERVGRNKENNADAEGDADAEKTEEAEPATSEAKGKKAAKAKPVVAAAPSDHDGSVRKTRQVLIFGIPVDITKKHFRALSTRGSKKTEVDLLKEDHELSAELHIVTPAGKIMLLTAPSRVEAAKVTTSLNNATIHSLIVAHQNHHTIKVAKQEMINKKKLAKIKGEDTKVALNAVPHDALEGLDLTKPRKEKLYARTVAQITPLEQRKRKCRLIIRNLSFLATEQNVLDKMSKFGPIVSVELPKKQAPEREQTGKTRKFPEKDRSEPKEHSMGFGFVTFLCESDASYVVEKVTGLKVCNREVAVDFCMAKETYEKYGKKAEEPTETEEAVEKDGEESVSSQKDDVEGSDVEDGLDAGSEDEEESEDDKENSEGEDEDEDASDNSDADSDAGSEADEEEEEKEEEKPKPKKEPTEDVHEGCTVFIRGLPFDADSSDIKFALGKYGRISLALVVKDKVTDISKGSAFVKFISPEFASACVNASQLNGGLSIKDRVCKIDLAVDRTSAQNIKDSEVAKRGRDRRNMYLANEGLILPGAENTAAAAEGAAPKAAIMSEADKEKRQRAQSEKNKKLQNPLFFVSGTRLSIRNLGKTVNDKELREICLNAAKNGIKKGLVKRADMEAYRAAQGNDFIAAQAALFNPKGTKSADPDAVPPAVGKQCLKNAKIMLDMQRIRGGAPQSRGYAFCEFTHHAHALAALRELNNNAAYSSHHSNAANGAVADPNGGKLIVEFSLENIQKVKILKDREVRAKNRNTPADADNAATTADKAAARALKRQHLTEQFEQNGGVAGLAKQQSKNKAVVEEAAPVQKTKPVKSYVAAKTAEHEPVALPEGVNPKHFNKKLEKERQQKRKRENKDKKVATSATDSSVVEEAKSSSEPVAKKAKVAAPAAAAVAVPAAVVKVQPKAVATPVAAPAVQNNNNSNKKRKQSDDAAPAPVAAAAAVPVATPVLAQNDNKKGKVEQKKTPVAPAAVAAPVATHAPQSKKAKTEAPAAAAPAVNKSENKKKDAPSSQKSINNTPNKNANKNAAEKTSPGSEKKNNKPDPVNADGTPQKRAWGGHKRLRAMKLKGKK